MGYLIPRKGPIMTKSIITLLSIAGLSVALQASACPEANYDGCVSDGYAIVEAEPVTYWPHNQMESAHLYQKPAVRYKRVRVRVRHRSLFSRCAR